METKGPHCPEEGTENIKSLPNSKLKPLTEELSHHFKPLKDGMSESMPVKLGINETEK